MAFDEAHACHGIASRRVGAAESAALSLYLWGGDGPFAVGGVGPAFEEGVDGQAAGARQPRA
jgi:hypothetical protein